VLANFANRTPILPITAPSGDRITVSVAGAALEFHAPAGHADGGAISHPAAQ